MQIIRSGICPFCLAPSHQNSQSSFCSKCMHNPTCFHKFTCVSLFLDSRSFLTDRYSSASFWPHTRHTHCLCWVWLSVHLSVKCWNSKYMFLHHWNLIPPPMHCVCLCLHRSGSNCTGTFFRCLPVDHLIGAVSTYKTLKCTARAREGGVGRGEWN